MKNQTSKWYAFTTDGDYCGVVLEELSDAWRIELFDSIQLVVGGCLVESGELRDIPKNGSRVFNDIDAFDHAYGALLNKLSKQSA